MSLSLSGEGIEYLDPGHVQTTFSYRYLYADTGYWGDERREQLYASRVGARITVHSIDFNLTYALTRRFSVSLITPFIFGESSNKVEHGGYRHETQSSGLGDLRLTANGWLWDPESAHRGNISLSLGVKAPTGKNNVRDVFYRRSDGKRHPVDIAIQLGDGGWGVITETQAFRQLREDLYAYLTGFYLVNPRETSHTKTGGLVYGEYRNTSVPDQYQARAGLSYVVWPSQALAVSLGARIDGIPVHDLIGGSDGWRRPGYSVYVEPGVSLTRWKTTFSLFVPVGVAYNRQKNVLDQEFNSRGPGAFAKYLVQFGVTREFNPLFWRKES